MFEFPAQCDPSLFQETAANDSTYSRLQDQLASANKTREVDNAEEMNLKSSQTQACGRL